MKSNDSSEIPDRRETSNIPDLPSGVLSQKKNTLHWPVGKNAVSLQRVWADNLWAHICWNKMKHPSPLKTNKLLSTTHVLVCMLDRCFLIHNLCLYKSVHIRPVARSEFTGHCANHGPCLPLDLPCQLMLMEPILSSPCKQGGVDCCCVVGSEAEVESGFVDASSKVNWV